VTVAARDGASGRTLWQRTYPPPEAAEWAERTPAWPGAQTEEIDAFLADDPDNLVLGLMRQSRRSLVGGHGVEVLTLPPYACQTDATRFDPLSGEVIWQASFPGVPVPLLAREAFTGLWSRRGRAGRIDLSSGANTLLSESPHHFGWPVRVGSAIAVPWHASSRVGVEWLDEAGGRLRAVAWPLRGVNRTVLHPIRAGVVLQTNEQRLWLLADDDAPLWDVRVKPYTYRVFQATSSAVFVGTDGKGGRLLGFDLASAEEVLNLRPAIGGAGDLTMVPGHEALLCPFSVSRSYRQPARLLVLSMRTLHHRLDDECGQLLGTWEHGAVCLGRHDGAQVAVFDLRSVT
jgi:hypothetical protein